MKLITFIITCSLALQWTCALSQETETVAAKSGWSAGGMPILSYDSDLGFKYGALGNLFDYGDGSIYPGYKHSLYTEFSHSTKGSDTFFSKYDSKFVFNNIRLSCTLGYFVDKLLDFYGFNGYESNYDHNLEDKNSHQYISKAFYKHSRKMFRSTFDMVGNIEGTNFKWIAGAAHFNMKMGSVDVKSYNKESGASDTLPSTETTPGLYEKYVHYGIINKNEKEGGDLISLKTGLVYDSRDNEANPTKGIWTEILMIGTNVISRAKPIYLQLVATHRHYFSLIHNRLSFASRIGIQHKLAGSVPYYMLPVMYSSNRPPMNGLGGYMNMRGVLRNRLQGEGLAYANFEMRWKAFKAIVKKKNNFYAAFTAFTDIGMVTKRYEIDKQTAAQLGSLWTNRGESLHQSLGLGLHLAYNHNFILSMYYGKPLDKQDGRSGLYTDIDFLF